MVLDSLMRCWSIWYHIQYRHALSYHRASSRVFPNFAQAVTNLPDPQDREFVCEEHLQDNEWETIAWQQIPNGMDALEAGSLNFEASLAVDPLSICIISREFTTPDNKSQDLQALFKQCLVDAALQYLAQRSVDRVSLFRS